MRLITGIGRALAMERLLKSLDGFITVAMLTALVLWGPVACYLVGCILDLLFAIAVLELHLRSIQYFGIDVIGIADIKKWIFGPVRTSSTSRWRAVRLYEAVTLRLERVIKPVARWVFGSYWRMVFIGSMISYLESDYVTLLLRKEGEGRLSVLIRVTLPAIAWSIGIWTAIYWCAVQGFGWAKDIVN